MAAGFPLCVNGTRIRSSEALYQSCRFPHRPEVQRLIIQQNSPMTAKMKSKPYRHDSRQDWDRVRVKIMRWCLRVKLAQNFRKFSDLLLETGARPIVEESRKDDFWGAKVSADGTLVGMNVLGRLLMELREALLTESRESLTRVQPIAIPEFLLYGRSIGIVAAPDEDGHVAPPRAQAQSASGNAGERRALQPSLFSGHAIEDVPASPQLGISQRGIRIADLNSYTEYKGSAQAWFGDVPRHWSVLPNRALFAEVKDRNHPDEEMLSVTISKGVVRQKVLLEDSSKKDSSNLDKSAYKLVQPRDLAYNKMRAWQGAIGASTLRGIISPAYVVLRLRNEDDVPSYFHHLYRTPQFAKEAERWSYGITSDMWSLRPEHFRMIYSPEPPVAEQAAIVRFLDWANGRLEGALQAKRKVIGLLDEQKQAIINRAVTRGLDPSVPLKPSGIPWLGEIPQHWTLRRFKFLARINSGQVDPRKAEYRELVLIAPNHIQSGSGRLLKQETADEQGADSGKYLVGRGQVIYSKIRPNLRKATIAPCDCLCSADMYAIAPKTGELSTQYILALLLSQPFTRFAVDTSMRVAMPKVNREALANCLMWYPGRQEQARILEFIAQEAAPLDAAISRLDREIELLREYRARLVADVAAGKLDVREAATRLVDESRSSTLSLEGSDEDAELEEAEA